MAHVHGGGGNDYDFKGFAPGELDSMFSSVFKNPLSSLSSFSVSFKLNTIPVVDDSDRMDIENTSPVEKSVETTFFPTPAFTELTNSMFSMSDFAHLKGSNNSRNRLSFAYIPRHHVKRRASNPISAVVNAFKKVCSDFA